MVRMSGQPFSYTFASGANGAFRTSQQNGGNLFYTPQMDSSGNITTTSDRASSTRRVIDGCAAVNFQSPPAAPASSSIPPARSRP